MNYAINDPVTNVREHISAIILLHCFCSAGLGHGKDRNEFRRYQLWLDHDTNLEPVMQVTAHEKCETFSIAGPFKNGQKQNC
jgi:hypothetical protein